MIPDEKAILVDEDDNVLEYRDRKDVGIMDRHRIVAVWIVDQHNRVLLAQRSRTMHIQPNRWGPAAAGTVTHTETYEETAPRELAEEIGLTGVALQNIGKFRVDEERGERRMCAVFYGKADFTLDDLKLQEEEVSATKLVDFDELKEDLRANPDEYVINMDLVIKTIEEQGVLTI